MQSRAELQRDLGALLGLAAVAMLLFALLRVLLVCLRWSELRELGFSELLQIFWIGARFDASVLGYLLMPAGVLLLLPARIGARPIAGLTRACALALALSALLEADFFAYYGFRANHLVLEHGADPEVIAAAFKQYAAPASLVALLAVLWLGSRGLGLLSSALARFAIPELPECARAAAGLALLALAFLAARGTLDHRALNPSLAALGDNRVANEIAGSGLFNLGYEAAHWHERSEMRMAAFYDLTSDAEADARTRCRLQGTAAAGSTDMVRLVGANAGAARIRNVVLIVMESFTARLVGTLGGDPALTPEFDALAREGLLLTHCYATGERTVQGLESLLSSFPSLPGLAVLRRPEAQHGFETLASILGRSGHDSLFLYGGQGIFDRMRGFFLGNGFKSFIEERDFQDVNFRGSWGVSDEDVFRRANREFQARSLHNQPFFGAILTVSLHSPWEFPRERAPELPAQTRVPEGFEREELANFLYADFAIGEFMREARTLSYSADTLFVFVGDHGVHLRGRELIPSEEYRVPALFLAPGHVAPGRLDGVTSQIDIAPTILGMLGGQHQSVFFGRDVRADDRSGGLAVLVYSKRLYGARRANRLTVLEPEGRRSAFVLDARERLSQVALSPAHDEDARDTLALLQVAERLLRSKRYSGAPALPPAEACHARRSR